MCLCAIFMRGAPVNSQPNTRYDPGTTSSSYGETEVNNKVLKTKPRANCLAFNAEALDKDLQ